MKAISLWQPWASFIAVGVKQFETRDWPPPLRLIGDRVAIHATTRPVDSYNLEWAARNGCTRCPLGVILCSALLIGAYRCGKPIKPGLVGIIDRREMPEIASIDAGGIPTDEFGDYSFGRWAWRLTDIERFEPPVPARGAQRLWQWSGT